jgi:hypothetical protein
VCINAQTIVSDLPHAGVEQEQPTDWPPGPDPVRLRPVFTRETGLALQGEIAMLYTIAVILLIGWLLGVVGTYTIGAFVHLLLVIAIVLFLVGLVTGRRTLA